MLYKKLAIVKLRALNNIVLIVTCGVLYSCSSKSPMTEVKEEFSILPPIEQLFLYNETSDSVHCSGISDPSDQLSGSMYLTKKGMVIFNIHPPTPDTSYYYFGTYTLQTHVLSYQITDVYYTFLKSDNFLVNDTLFNADYQNGRIRKVKSPTVTLLKANCDNIAYVYPYSAKEKAEASKRLNGIEPYGKAYIHYKETPDMKFYSFLYKNVPALDSLF